MTGSNHAHVLGVVTSNGRFDDAAMQPPARREAFAMVGAISPEHVL